MSGAFTIRWVDSADAIDAGLWQRCFLPPVEGAWWYRAMERSGLQDQFTFYYAIIEDAGKAVGIAPCFMMDVPIDLVAPPAVAAVLRYAGAVVPRLRYQRTLFVGSPCADEGTIGLTENVSLADVCVPLQQAVERRARETGAPMIVWKDFPQNDDLQLQSLVQDMGMFRLISYPGTRVPLPAGGYEGYLKWISSDHRHHLKKKIKRGEAVGALAVSVVQHPDANTRAEIFALFWQTYLKGHTKFEKLNPRFFEEIAALDVAHWVLLRHVDGGKLAAFMLCFLMKPRAINKFIGLDYTLAGDWYLYFRLWREAVRWACDAGVSEMQSGQTGYRAKLDLEHMLVPLNNYCKHRNPAIHWVFAKVARGITWESLDHDLKNYVNSKRGRKYAQGL